VKGFIALLGNEIGWIFLQPEDHDKEVARALMDKAQDLHGDLEVFKEWASVVVRRVALWQDTCCCAES